jgi:hypothetical protein
MNSPIGACGIRLQPLFACSWNENISAIDTPPSTFCEEEHPKQESNPDQPSRELLIPLN